MAKKVKAVIKLQITAGQATPAPPVGPALGQHGVNASEFVKAFNAQTQNQGGITVSVVVTIYGDRTFSFILKTPPAAVLLKMAAKIAKASGEPNREKIGSVTQNDLKEIAEKKMVDLNAGSIEAAMRMIEGTARSMGINVEQG